eukprot:gene51821-38091_t
MSHPAKKVEHLRKARAANVASYGEGHAEVRDVDDELR